MKKLFFSLQSSSPQSSVQSGVTLEQDATSFRNNFGTAQSPKLGSLSDREPIPNSTSSDAKAKSNDGGYIWIV